MMKCVSEFDTMQQRLNDAEVKLKTLQQTRQKDIWQLLCRWSLEVSNKPRPVYELTEQERFVRSCINSL